MSSELHRRAKELFLGALEQPPETREAWLARAYGGDEELQREVCELFANHDAQTKDFAPLFEDLLATGTEALRERFVPGMRIAGRYEIVRKLGVGGMGEVYLARDGVVGGEVALKFPPHALASKPRWVERLVAEARLARAVTHPGVCRVYDIGEADGELFLSMEYIDGVDLATWLRRSGRIPAPELRRMALELCASLTALHREGVLHRDLKPSNVLVDREGGLHVADFGLAASVDSAAGAGVEAGSPAYMAPELLRGGAPSVQSDIYSLGLILYELVARRRPFGSIAELAGNGRVAPPLAPEVDPVLARIVQSCLELDPRLRPDSAQRLEYALSRRDPLAAVLALGELPSPAVVAASGARGLLTPARALGVFGLFLLLLTLFVPLASEALPVQRAAPPFAPAELALAAERMLAELIAAPPDKSRAFGYSGQEILALGGSDSGRWTLDQGDEKAGLFFWFRAGDESLAPRQAWTLFYGGGRTRPDDPPLQLPGSATVVLGLDGRLLFFVHAPRLEELASRDTRAPRWEPLLRLADLEAADLVETHALPVESVADRRVAWEDAERGLRIEAGSAAGQPVLFAVLREQAEGAAGPEARRELADAIYDGVLVLLLVLAVPMAWRLLRRGGGDPWGALRLGLAVLGLRLSSWVLGASHQVDLTGELTLFIVALSSGLFDALTAFLFYMAVEPLVRRQWPRVLVSWSRVLRGRLADALVASHVLLGATVGVLLALFTVLDAELAARLGGEQAVRVPGYAIQTLAGPAAWLAVLPEEAVNALWNALVLLMLLVVARLAFRGALAAVAVSVALIGTVHVLSASEPAVAWLTLGLGQVLIGYLVLVRLGVLAFVAALFVQYVIEDFPTTVDLGAWYGASTVFALGVVVTLAAAALAGVLRWGRLTLAGAEGKSENPVRGSTPSG